MKTIPKQYLKDMFLFGGGILILFLPCYLLLFGQFFPEPTPIPIPLPIGFDTNLCTSNDSHSTLIQSPNQRYCAVVRSYNSAVSITSPDKEQVDIDDHGKWSRFLGWSDDSRYAFVETFDQYSNEAAIAFDTRSWTIIYLYDSQNCPGNMSGNCAGGIAAISPSTTLVLLQDGTLFDLTNGSSRHVLPPELGYIHTATWSEDGTRISVWGALSAADYRDANKQTGFDIKIGDSPITVPVVATPVPTATPLPLPTPTN